MRGIAKCRGKTELKKLWGADRCCEHLLFLSNREGFSSWLIEKAIRLSVDEHNLPLSLLKIGSCGFSKNACLFEKAGISRALTEDGYACARIYFSIGGLLAGGLLGACFSPLLAAIGSIAGAIWVGTCCRGRSKKRFVVVPYLLSSVFPDDRSDSTWLE